MERAVVVLVRAYDLVYPLLQRLRPVESEGSPRSGWASSPSPPPLRLPDGTQLRPGDLSPEEERDLLSGLAPLPFHEVRLHGVAARRTVVHYGWEYGYESRQVAPGPTLPPFREPLRARAAAVAGLDAGALEQVLVARYPPGAGIGWHRDAPMFGPLVVTDGGRPHPRVGGLTRAEAKGEDGRR